MTNEIKRVHIIAMGGSVMHALAIALKKQGIEVTGSDDNFFNPSKARLAEHGLLPEASGWYPEKINSELDIVILGMHAHADNLELLRAQQLGLRIVSFPEFIFEQSKEKQRVVIGGSHGKTTITSMVMHVLKFHKRAFDHVVGAKVNGFEETVKLSDAPIIVIEGDEYLSSRIDPTPKFHHYRHQIGLISGIAWDHVNVFPTEENYLRQFEIFADATPKDGALVYNSEDSKVEKIGLVKRPGVEQIPYQTHRHKVSNGETYLISDIGELKVKVFGEHNMLNLNGAKEILLRLGISNQEFYEAMPSFELPALRLNILKSGPNYTVFRDYAHAPSKVKATVRAVKALHPARQLTGVFELHTYSSLSKDFFANYADTLTPCDEAVVFYNPKAVAQKKLAPISPEEIKAAFNHPNLEVLSDTEDLKDLLEKTELQNRDILLMSSSNFDELALNSLY